MPSTPEQNANFVTTEQVQAAAESAGLPPEQVDSIVTAYPDSQIAALKAAFSAVVLGALVSLWYVKRLPTKAGTGDEADVSSVAQASAA